MKGLWHLWGGRMTMVFGFDRFAGLVEKVGVHRNLEAEIRLFFG